ncbi:MAG: ArnT family glycosyltransferase, partial [Planctomycetota bacterium]
MNEGSSESVVGAFQQPVSWVSRYHHKWVLGVCAVVLVVYFAALSSQWWVGEDGALYLCLARNLARGDGYILGGQAHTLVPPGFPAILAALMLIGADSFLAMNIVIGLMGLAAAGVCYLMLREVIHRDWALLLTVVFVLSNELLQRSGEILSDVPLALLILAAIWLYLRGLRKQRPDRRAWELASLLLVASCWIHMRAFPLVLGAGIGLVLSAWKTARWRALVNLGIVVLGCAATAGAFSYFAQSHATSDAQTYIGGLRHFTESLSVRD